MISNNRLQSLGVAALLAVCLATTTLWAQTSVKGEAGGAEQRLVLRFVTEGDFPPFNYVDDEGVLTGFNVDIARAICLEASVACDVQVRPWDELFPALNRGEADAVIAAHAITPRALASVDFTDRYFHTPGRFAARRDGTKLEVTPDGLDGSKIGVARGTAHEAFLRVFFRDSAIVAFDSPELARDALLAAKVDLIFDDGISLSFWVGGTSSRECCELVGGPFHEPKYFGDGIAIAVSKKDPQLTTLLNAALKRVRASGRYEELVLRYFPTRIY